jgi:hypothetical protein
MEKGRHSQLDKQGAGWGDALRAGQDLYGLSFRFYNSNILKHPRHHLSTQ